MPQEYIFSNLPEITKEQDAISPEYTYGKWRAAEYQAGEVSGYMLVAPETELPEPVTLNLNLAGIYRIYLCFPKLRSQNYFYAKLSDDLCFTGIKATDKRPIVWCEDSYFEEVYWKTADLTGQSVILGKPEPHFDSVAGLAWIRCIPASESELVNTITNKCLQTHIDEDALTEDTFYSDDDYLIRMYPMKNTNTEIISFEFSFDYDKCPDIDAPRLHRHDIRWDRGQYAFDAKKETVYRKAVDFAHANGMELFATNRMEVANFFMPYTRLSWDFQFVKDHPEFYCRNRNGSIVKACSFAYEEVQDYVIANFVNMIQYGFDGISLIYHRGTFLGFEQPVIDRFKEQYPHLVPCTLPFADERLHGVWCSFMNQFMEKLRRAMDANSDRHIKINVITDYGLETSKHIGLDVAHWAKNGWIDIASQADMEILEDLDGCMRDDAPELIDLEKYNRILKERPIVTRNFSTDVEKVCKHIPEYRNLNTLYGTEVYHVLPWVGTILPEEYDDAIAKMTVAGAEKFLSWNANHVVRDLHEWYVISRIGNTRDDSFTKRNFYRVLSLDGYDVSQFNPNWRG